MFQLRVSERRHAAWRLLWSNKEESGVARSVTALAVAQRLLSQLERGVRHHERATQGPRGTRWSRQSPRYEERRVGNGCLAGLPREWCPHKEGSGLGLGQALFAESISDRRGGKWGHK